MANYQEESWTILPKSADKRVSSHITCWCLRTARSMWRDKWFRISRAKRRRLKSRDRKSQLSANNSLRIGLLSHRIGRSTPLILRGYRTRTQGNSHSRTSTIRMNPIVRKRGNKSMILLSSAPKSTASLQFVRQKKYKKQVLNQLTTLLIPPTFRSLSLKPGQRNTFLSKAARRLSATPMSPNKTCQLSSSHKGIHSKGNLSSAMCPFTSLGNLKSNLSLSKEPKGTNREVEARRKFAFHTAIQAINLSKWSVDSLKKW